MNVIRTNAKTRSQLHKAAKRGTGILAVVGTSATGFALATYIDSAGTLALLTGKFKTQKAACAKAETVFGRPNAAKVRGVPLPTA